MFRVVRRGLGQVFRVVCCASLLRVAYCLLCVVCCVLCACVMCYVFYVVRGVSWFVGCASSVACCVLFDA